MANGYHGSHGHHGHHSHWSGSVGVVIGAPLGWPWYYQQPYYPYYSYPLIVETTPSTPPVYIERGSDQDAQAPPSYYYCSNPQGYYPYVRTCPGGWQEVPVQPPSPP